ncbi:ornithine carbamoyltransferase [Moraxella caviae]|uniref:Ornithine carbamoyltransferase n=1 Tax=Moraxella caviae TaxID=34060 RepID=A0A1T0A374_9GAMM|nr:ornithine carbamoyltransferase [Moraxella caviae]OOR90048.1 ornithine carbamoyltransferase [Moraxella caviae]STZ14651.1 Ornithine carbamoyltransferase [Moraxella caviae]VEW13329.1 Ornithine carbamoyltransferase [Moraxella caviae]
MSVRHFLTLMDLSKDELQSLIRRACELKAMQRRGEIYRPFVGRTLAMIFEKSSTRTRVSFETGMGQFGGQALFLSPNDTQLGRGEPIEDSARVISSMTDIVMIRTFSHAKVETFAKYSSVPVINALTDDFHPCQLLADMQTFYEHRGSIEGKTVVWVGDGNNMCHSYMIAAHQFGFNLVVAAPDGYKPNAELLAKYAHCTRLVDDPKQAVKGAHLVVTDVWASMGQEAEQAKREKDFADYQVNAELLDLAQEDVLFMHCLPAHRGEEISEDLLDDPRSVVWDEAENRLHAQKALMEFLLKDKIKL